ncbi:gamma-glutamyl-gamma-aminobutyrate hydrolase family protein [Thalassotalea sp. PS06]|uniref:gamma-glutamyl-gamma-aminobutyrate hydrolase family protein n=1 Tax=Thalassotalea sp. PS06 TaxID=2594005 RepID=UPI001165B6F7|nr:gamma-glutamyl-gamma-aminobutyrate hydrolase family protein [Thalassotalea sp. PS06]QDP00084.1 gamma-glutamyl-gamma-aminobutyrate hydrolase family protein [Thalassotalea sp. PS06]
MTNSGDPHQSTPLVGVVCDMEIIGPHPFHVAGHKYIHALVAGSNCTPVLIPALGNLEHLKQLIHTLDGILLTGGYSMVNPVHYDGSPADAETKLDGDRDSTTLPLINLAIEAGVPVLGICRGFQEMNVALGGSLHQKLHETGQYIEHREDKEKLLEQQYDLAHSVRLNPDGQLYSLFDSEDIEVNSLHTQGVDQLAPGLNIEAVATDGLVEAFSVKDATSFAIAVQWHPEWQFNNNNYSRKLFSAFGQACQQRQQVKNNHG